MFYELPVLLFYYVYTSFNYFVYSGDLNGGYATAQKSETLPCVRKMSQATVSNH